ncbi:MAG: hypothetical protein M3552_20005 [Planctomycetota bacterium]|nr:hypothetical protein [Planctomycetota bacterium]
MTYSTIQPPFTLKFREMPKRELRLYFEWFLNVIPQRVSELAGVVRDTQGFEDWQPDGTPSSLDSLGEWFANQVETRQRTSDELIEITSRSALSFPVSGEELTNRTFSLAMDIGMYLSQVLARSNESLQWEQPLKDKNVFDYGQPVLVGRGDLSLNPVHISVTLAYGLARKTKTGKRLRELYNIWEEKLSKQKNPSS